MKKLLSTSTALQSGRSMTEMLGVLAIIGVLSVGAVAGYSYAMDKYRANTIMNDVNLRAVDLIAQTSRGGDLSLAEWPTKTASDCDIGLEIDTTTSKNTGGISVSDIKQHICEIIADDLLPEDVELVIDGEKYISGKCGETNKMVFYYDAVGEALGNDNEECNGVKTEVGCVSCPADATLSTDKTTCECSEGKGWNISDNICQTVCSDGQFIAKNSNFKISVQIADLTFDNSTQIGDFQCNLTGIETISEEEWYSHFLVQYTGNFETDSLCGNEISSLDDLKKKCLPQINDLCIQYYLNDFNGLVSGVDGSEKSFYIGGLKMKNEQASYGESILEYYACTENEDGNINFDTDGGLPLPF